MKTKILLIRYPDRNFVSSYNWLDGIGPVDRRPARLNLAWDWIEPNCIVLDRFAYRMPKARVE